MPTKTLGRPKLYAGEMEVCFTEHQLAGIRKQASTEEVPRAEVVRRAVDKYLEEN